MPISSTSEHWVCYNSRSRSDDRKYCMSYCNIRIYYSHGMLYCLLCWWTIPGDYHYCQDEQQTNLFWPSSSLWWKHFCSSIHSARDDIRFTPGSITDLYTYRYPTLHTQETLTPQIPPSLRLHLLCMVSMITMPTTTMKRTGMIYHHLISLHQHIWTLLMTCLHTFLLLLLLLLLLVRETSKLISPASVIYNISGVYIVINHTLVYTSFYFIKRKFVCLIDSRFVFNSAVSQSIAAVWAWLFGCCLHTLNNHLCGQRT